MGIIIYVHQLRIYFFCTVSKIGHVELHSGIEVLQNNIIRYKWENQLRGLAAILGWTTGFKRVTWHIVYGRVSLTCLRPSQAEGPSGQVCLIWTDLVQVISAIGHELICYILVWATLANILAWKSYCKRFLHFFSLFGMAASECSLHFTGQCEQA